MQALNLDSLNTNTLDRHLDKIYRYDTVGNVFNIILVYVRISNFSKFCEKYFEHIKKYQYVYPLISADDRYDVENFPYADIRVMQTRHDRNGCDTILYHVCVLIGWGLTDAVQFPWMAHTQILFRFIETRLLLNRNKIIWQIRYNIKRYNAKISSDIITERHWKIVRNYSYYILNTYCTRGNCLFRTLMDMINVSILYWSTQTGL